MVLKTISGFQVTMISFELNDVIFSVQVALFEYRHLWISVYLDHHFWAEMRSTQRSESIHAFF
ncbi:hypothetical protein Ahy_A06g027241 [Arachis hypogaea]|uniref:Protein FAR1-RELATED SEQUENCE n=1 Tax=Arachis hypogaea TaxID=3818 RepID=A0A445CN29_ARAHY|nr:hypothetical protein Ahy_A06g027241 [Arachis hypogaea]